MSSRGISPLWDEYHERFGEWFPTMCFHNESEKEWSSRIQECLDHDKTAEELYDLDYSGDIVY